MSNSLPFYKPFLTEKVPLSPCVVLLETKITDFPALSYAPTNEILTLSNVRSLKMCLLRTGAKLV